MPALLVALAILGLVTILIWRRNRRLERERYIRDYPLPRGLLDKLAKRRPELDLKQRTLVARALRQFFLAYLNSGRRYVAMPSRVVDDLWHEFILYTKAYDAFCHKAFGRFLHPTPAVALGADKHDNEGLRRVWWQACKEENIDPMKPLRLPLLFALDAKLGIADGFRYVPDRSALKTPDDGGVHYGSSFSDISLDGGTDGLGDGDGCGGGDGGCDGGGDGGGGGGD